jgi:hypothetical protein
MFGARNRDSDGHRLIHSPRVTKQPDEPVATLTRVPDFLEVEFA